MNEQQSSERLDALITAQFAGKNSSAATDDERMIAELIRLKLETKPNPQFIAALEGRLKQEDKTMTQRFFVRQLVAAAAVVVFCAVGVTFQSELRAFAQEVINLFNPAESDERTIEVELGGVTDPTVIEVEPSVGSADDMPFEVLRPAFIPASYSLSVESYDETDGATMRYTCNSNPYWAFSVLQYTTAAYQIEVGESAAIETVTLENGAAADYIRGEWSIGNTPPEVTEDAEVGTTFTMTQVWQGESEVQQMFWTVEGINYYLWISGTDAPSNYPPECAINQETFITIANSLE